MLNINRNVTQNDSWRNAVKEIKTAVQELNSYGRIMTAYERDAISRDINSKRSAVIGRVLNESIGEYKQAIKKYQDRHQAFENEKVKETQRWDLPKLNGEIAAIKSLVDLTITGLNTNALAGGNGEVAPKLERIYQDAMKTGDIHTQRAACEVFSALSGTMPKQVTDKFAVNGLARGAYKELKMLRFSDGMVDALDKRNQAADEIRTLKKELSEVSVIMGEGNPNDIFANNAYTKAFKQTRFNDDGSVEVFAENSPEVTGINWHLEERIQVGGNE